MMQKKPINEDERMRTLANRFLEGESTLDEERELTRLLEGNNVSPEWESLRLLLTGLESIALPKDEEVLPAPPPNSHSNLWGWMTAAAAAIIIVIGFGVWKKATIPEEECVAIVYGQQYTDRDIVMKEMSQSLSIVAETQQEDVDDILNAVFNNDN